MGSVRGCEVKNACKTPVLRATNSVSERAVRPAPGQAQTDCLFDSFAEVFVGDPGGDRGRPRLPLPAVGSAVVPGPGRLAAGQGPGAKRMFATPSRAAISPARWASSKAQTESAVLTWRCRRARSATARRCGRSPRRRRPSSARRSRRARRGAEAGRSRADRVRQPFHCSPPRAAPGSAGSAEGCVAVISVCPSPARGAASASRRRRSSSESTSSRSRSGGGESSEASARSSARTASRCSPCDPNPRSSRPAEIARSSRWGPSPVVPRATSASRRASRATTDGGVALVAENAAGKAELLERPRNRARAPPSSPAAPRRAARRGRRRAPSTARPCHAATGRAEPGAARRSAARAPQRSPAAGRCAAGSRRASARSR